MPASEWIKPDRWKVKAGSVDPLQIPPGDMADDDLLTITDVGGLPGHELDRKHLLTTTPWGQPCLMLPPPIDYIVAFTHHGVLGPCYLKRVAGIPPNRDTIECWLGVFTKEEGEGAPTGAAWIAEDQT